MMAYEQKTKETEQSVIEFIENIESVAKKRDAYALLELFTEASGYPAKMWGPSIIGFGRYSYKYATGHSGEAPLVGFSPRKAKTSLYFATGLPNRDQLLERFGKYTAGKGCVYINKLADVEPAVMMELIKESITFLFETYSDSNHAH